jgi:uncharacterized protein DUF5666
MRFARPRAVAGCAGFALLVLAGCDSPTTAPRGLTQFSRVVSLPQVHDQLASGATRAEIKIVPASNPAVAREVKLKDNSELTEAEQVRGPVTAIDGTAGSVTLAIGAGLKIGFDAGTRFRAEGEDGDLTRDAFVARVQTALAAGGHPAVRAERAAPATPQAPDDPAFTASELKLDEEADLPEIELNVTTANLTINSTSPPDGFITVLNLKITINAQTELEVENPDVDEVEFEGQVKAVDLSAQSFTLASGTVVKIVAGTQIEAEGDDGEHLGTLTAVKAALDAGQTVEAEGEGVAESGATNTLDAIDVEFQVREAPMAPGEVEFEGDVTKADVGAGSFMLDNGAVVKLTTGTHISAEGNLLTLQAVAEALTAGHRVRAEGHATVDAAGPPPQLTALDVKFETES